MNTVRVPAVDFPVRSETPRLLVSVRDLAEAQAAVEGGADWIDLKEPTAGALGAVSIETAREVAEWVGSRRPLSAALGELSDWRECAARQLLEVPTVSAVKLGLAGCAESGSWRTEWLSAAEEIQAAGKTLVAVVYADWRRVGAPRPDEILSLAEQTTCQHLLVDTFDKKSRSSLAQLGETELRRILNWARRSGLRTVVAGRITRGELGDLPGNLIDVVGVRGGVCPADREGTVEARLVTEMRHAWAAVCRCHSRPLGRHVGGKIA